MSNSIILEIDGIDICRGGYFPISTLLLWAQKCRVQIYTSGALRALRETTGGAMMVKAQTFQYEEDPAELPMFGYIKVTQTIAHLGKTSMSLGIEFHIGKENRRFARANIVMVCVANGKAQEIPEEIRDAFAKELKATAAETKAELESEVEKLKRAISADEEKNQVKKLEQDILLRLSDEDLNKHVRHTRYAQFVEDILNQGESIPLTLMSLEYLKETRAGERCVTHAWQTANGKCIRFEIRRQPNDEIVCRGYARY